MTINFIQDYDLDLGFCKNQLVEEIIGQAVDYMDCPYEIEVNVSFTNNSNIADINKEYRDIEDATDVLSFPMIEYYNPGDFTFLENSIFEFNPDTGELMLGDIIISLDKVVEQAIEYGHTVERELAFLTVHSMLHLFGFDHIDGDERIIMEDKQKEILNNLGIHR